MLDDALIEQLNRGYVCPPDAGPAWRAACAYGFDMSLVEVSLRQTPDERLQEHQRALDMALALNPSLATDALIGAGVGIALLQQANPRLCRDRTRTTSEDLASLLELKPTPDADAAG